MVIPDKSVTWHAPYIRCVVFKGILNLDKKSRLLVNHHKFIRDVGYYYTTLGLWPLTIWPKRRLIILTNCYHERLNNEEIRAILDRYWEATVALDLERIHEIYHDDVVVERIRKKNIYELRAHYPAKLNFRILRTRGEGNLWITELIITYDGRPV